MEVTSLHLVQRAANIYLGHLRILTVTEYTEWRSLGDQIWAQNESDWPQMGQIRDFFRSDFSTFWRQLGTFSDQISVYFGAATKCTDI